MALGQRIYERDIASLIIRYSLPAYISGKVLSAMMEDYSFSGLRMVTGYPLEEGQEIVINGGLFEDALPAIVRWHKNIGDTAFKVGLEFKR